MREDARVGLDALAGATRLLQRVRAGHPTAGLLDAAEVQWWWRMPRATDRVPQLAWFDAAGRPEAMVLATDWGDAVALDPVTLPGAPADRVEHVVARGLAHAEACGLGPIEVVADRADAAMAAILARHGFAADAGDTPATPALSVAIGWLDATARPRAEPMSEGYHLASRLDTLGHAHHFVRRNGADVGARLRQTSLYRPELDLVVLDPGGEPAAYALFWRDPATATGVVEPMRTEDGHRRRGLARRLLAAGLERLAAAGAARIKICWSPDNPAARDLYLATGFVPDKQTAVFTRRSP